MAGIPWRVGGETLWPATHARLSHAIKHHGDEGNRDALFHRLANLQLLQGEEQLLAEAGGADQRSNHDHGEGLHHDLVKTQQQRLLSGGQFHLPQQLARRAAAHLPGFDNFARYPAYAKYRAARHRRHGEDERRQHGRHLSEAEHDHHRSQIGHVWRRLHDVKDGGLHALYAGVSRGPYAEHEAERRCERRSHQDYGQGLHRIGPQTEHRQIQSAETAEEREAAAAEPVAQNRRAGDDRHPRQRWQFPIRHASEQQHFDNRQRLIQQPRDGARQRFYRRAEPGKESRHPLAEGDYPFGGPFVEGWNRESDQRQLAPPRPGQGKSVVRSAMPGGLSAPRPAPHAHGRWTG